MMSITSPSKLSKSVTDNVLKQMEEKAFAYIKVNKTVVILAVAVILALIIICLLMSKPQPNQEIAPSLEKVFIQAN